MDRHIIIPIFGMLTGIIIPVAVFIWLYFEGKGKRETVLEISKHLDDPAKLEELLGIFEERKKQPIDYRRNGGDHHFCWYRALSTRLSSNWKYLGRCRMFGGCHWSRYSDCRIPLSKHW